jgi:uncharacterized membrane protein required for colicin V production
MFSDVLIILFGIASCFNGWNRGFSRSLRGLIATVAAMFAVPFTYPPLAAWLYSKIDVDAVQATVIAYLMCLFALIALITAILVQLFNSYWEDNPWLVDRFGGFVYGGAKTALIVVLAVMVSLAPVKLPAQPYGRMKFNNFTEGSKFFLPKALPWAQQLVDSKLAKYLITKHSLPASL